MRLCRITFRFWVTCCALMLLITTRGCGNPFGHGDNNPFVGLWRSERFVQAPDGTGTFVFDASIAFTDAREYLWGQSVRGSYRWVALPPQASITDRYELTISVEGENHRVPVRFTANYSRFEVEATLPVSDHLPFGSYVLVHTLN